MTPGDIQKFCIAGTKAYLQFLEANRRGVQEIDVARIGPVQERETTSFKLILQARLFSPEMVSLRLCPPGREFGPKDFTVVEYDADAKCLLVEVRNPDLDLGQRPAREVKVIADLRFLVRNVCGWFEQHGGEVLLPTRQPAAPSRQWVDPQVLLEPGQRKAVETLLANPLTYVWGPPGTGKTRHVLVAAVAGMVLAGKKVGIYAPTNNALEQALGAVILALDERGKDRHQCLRVGSPSAKFAAKFPEVCEVQGLKGQIAGLKRQWQNYVDTLHHRRGAAVLISAVELHKTIVKLATMQDRQRKFYGLLAVAQEDLLGVIGRLTSLEDRQRESCVHLADTRKMLPQAIEKLASLEEEQHKLCGLLADAQRELQTESGKLGPLVERQRELHRLLAGGLVQNVLSRLRGDRAEWRQELAELAPAVQRQQDKVRGLRVESERLNSATVTMKPNIAGQLRVLQQLRTKQEQLNQAIAELEPKIGGHQKTKRHLHTRSEKLNRIITRLGAKITGMLALIQGTRTQSDKVNKLIARLDMANPRAAVLAIAGRVSLVSAHLKKFAAIAAEHEALSDEELRRRIAELGQQIEKLDAQTLEQRIHTASVIGMTLDCHIGRYHDQCIPFDRVFLDEAGYAPAVKALTLLRRNLPLAFIGDHKQLDPVFEMDNTNLGLPQHHPALVWKKSALFVDDLFAAESAKALVHDWFGLSDPRLCEFAKVPLRKTFRFGKSLTAVLAECVYHGMDFVSAAAHQNLQITCLGAVPYGPPAKKRENTAEVKCIARYLQAHPELRGGPEGAWIILTPYKNQVALLGTMLPDARREERIMTLHASQGREWDAVFLSVVDGHFNLPWFTDSTKRESGGLYVMNTAVSRARRHLILVCDKAFWEGRPDAQRQLIARLLGVGG